MTGGVSMQSFTALDTSIALDTNGYPRISYRNFFGTNLEVAQFSASSVVSLLVDYAAGRCPSESRLYRVTREVESHRIELNALTDFECDAGGNYEHLRDDNRLRLTDQLRRRVLPACDH